MPRRINETSHTPKFVSLVSYWPTDFNHGYAIIRHTSQAEAGYIAGCQKHDPSACVWMVPGTERDNA